jgi:hypothetical protein
MGIIRFRLMNILDENILESQRQLLRSWRVHVSQIGHEIGYQGIKDDAIISLFHELKSATFFTRDLGFYRPQLCHACYCLVCLDVGQYEIASFIRRFLRYPNFNTQAKRMSCVVRVSSANLRCWKRHREKEETLNWF